MLTEDVLKYYSPTPDDLRGAKKAVTDALGLSSGYVSQWGQVVPEPQAMRLHFLTNGALTYDPSVYQRAKAS